MTGDVCPIPKTSEFFSLEKQIGTGSFANVYKATDKKTNTHIALKLYRMQKMDLTNFARAAAEMAFIKFLKHPNIISFACADIQKQYMYLGIEYSGYGSLSNFMEKQMTFSEVTIQQIMKQLVCAICYLHEMCIFHGDVKPENIIVTDIKQNNLIIKLSDFGLAEVILKTETYHKKTGSFFYMAPEIHLGFPADHTSDVYSAGIVMYELLYGHKPYDINITKEEYVTILRRRVEIVYPHFESSFFSQHCLGLVMNLLSYDKKARLHGEALVKHPFLNSSVIRDEQNHYMRACECLLQAVDFVNNEQFGAGYIEITEAIIHMKIQINRIQHDEGLYRYMVTRYRDYIVYCDKVEEKLTSDSCHGPLYIQTHAEKLRCLLKTTPALLSAYDLCLIGEMYHTQSDIEQGAQIIKQGLELMFPLLVNEPDGLRKHLLSIKLDHWVKLLEDFVKQKTRRHRNTN